ncbi:MAG: tetratricopeptide repeat protein [Anaerolineae bacterium]|nr:tetratricopeptide repeat protein [Anaerolineae bacterium]
MADTNEQLRQAFALMKQGNRHDSIAIVQNVLKQDRGNASAWWLLANLLEDHERKVKALERVLALEPNHKGATAMMAKLNPPVVSPFVDDGELPAGVDLSTPEGRATPEKLTKAKYREVEKADTEVPLSIKIAFGFLVLFVVGLIIIFGVIPILRGVQPVDVMNEYFAALSDQNYDRLRELTCEKDLYQIDVLEQQFASMQTMLQEGQTLRFETSELRVDLIEQTDTEAFVNIGGRLTISAGDALEMTFNIDQLLATAGLPADGANARLIVENGWKVCDP